MRKFPSIVLTLLVPFCAQAAPLTPEAALQRALGDAPRRVAGNSGSYRLATTRQSNGSDAIYVFTRPASDGFIVTPADDHAPALLGYGEANLTDETGNFAPGMTYWLDQLARQVEYAASHEGSRRISKARPEREAIEPLCKTLWNQSTPYNDLCPEVNGERSVTGCVATAMSQAMKYHNWPETGTGRHSYRWNRRNLSINFAEEKFKWDMMLDNYDVNSTREECNAVAELMKAAGYSVDMNYSPMASGASSMSIATALGEYFRYDKASLKYLDRDFYSLYEWEEIIYTSLCEDGPVIYNGQSDDGGHSFICDGYSTDGYFHFNWGWGGISDGYFLLNALDPLEQGIGGASAGFNFMQDAITGIRPDRDGNSQWKPTLAYYEPLKIEKDFHDGEPVIVQTNLVYNCGPAIFLSGKVGFCFQKLSTDGTACGEPFFDTEEIGEPIAVLYGFNGYGTYLNDLEPARYLVTMVYSYDGDNYLPIRGATYDTTSYILDTTQDEAQLVPIEPAVPEFRNAVFEAPLYYWSKIKATGTLVNTSDTSIHNFATALLMSQDYTTAVAVGRSVVFDLEPGESMELKYETPYDFMANIQPGTYPIAMAVLGNDGTYALISEPQQIAFLGDGADVDNITDSHDNGESIYYTSDGIMVARHKAGEARPTLPPGLYIVRSDSATTKIIVK